MQIIEAGAETTTGDMCYILVNGEHHINFTKAYIMMSHICLCLNGTDTSIILYGDTAEEFKRLWAEVEK